ncbi:MAG: SDR family NAD(P)-dependent oxidoreductase [Candidatus Obscuribacterales bacterium]|nr:SDR family NAD(P)-dependent oxidoreductase [Candidatus Obscuribacterales bacterium]
MSRTNILRKGLKAVITGASSGIGKALALRLAGRYKAQLVINGRNEDQLRATRQEIEAEGGSCLVMPGDLCHAGLAESLVDQCLNSYNGLDLLVNNAGMAHPGRVVDLSPEDWRAIFEVNFFAALSATYRALPHFKKQGYGKIVNISSIAGKIPFAGSVCYAASKHAMTAMSAGMAAELSRDNIDVLTISPGWVRTEFFEKNNIDRDKNPTLIAEKNNASGLLMRYLLSISAEKVARQIDHALSREGSQEIIMTAPGKLIERLQGIFPGLIYQVNSRLPLSYVEPLERLAQ